MVYFKIVVHSKYSLKWFILKLKLTIRSHQLNQTIYIQTKLGSILIKTIDLIWLTEFQPETACGDAL